MCIFGQLKIFSFDAKKKELKKKNEKNSVATGACLSTLNVDLDIITRFKSC